MLCVPDIYLFGMLKPNGKYFAGKGTEDLCSILKVCVVTKFRSNGITSQQEVRNDEGI